MKPEQRENILIFLRSFLRTFTQPIRRKFRVKRKNELLRESSEYGTEDEIFDFTQWFARQPFTYKIFIAGNHDLFLEIIPLKTFRKMIGNELIYLQNTEVTINGLKIYGSPVNQNVMGMAFGKNKGAEIRREWRKIPEDVDILITHEAPLNILDNGKGCPDLKLRLEAVKPKIKKCL